MKRCPTCNAPVLRRLSVSEQLEQVVSELRVIVDRLEVVEDRLDRYRRPYGDGDRRDVRRRW